MKNLTVIISSALSRKKSEVKASISTLRTALRAADVNTMDDAIDLVAYFIKSNQPGPEALETLLQPIDGDEAFNQRISLVKLAAGV